jgi:hypothetical protein
VVDLVPGCGSTKIPLVLWLAQRLVHCDWVVTKLQETGPPSVVHWQHWRCGHLHRRFLQRPEQQNAAWAFVHFFPVLAQTASASSRTSPVSPNPASRPRAARRVLANGDGEVIEARRVHASLLGCASDAGGCAPGPHRDTIVRCAVATAQHSPSGRYVNAMMRRHTSDRFFGPAAPARYPGAIVAARGTSARAIGGHELGIGPFRDPEDRNAVHCQ